MNGTLRGRAASAFALAFAIALAKPVKAGPLPSPPTAAPRTSAIAYLVTEIATGLGPLPEGAIVVAAPITSDVPAPKSDALAVRFADQLAGRLAAARAHPQPATLAVARRISGREAGRAARRSTSLAYVQLTIDHGTLRVVADLYPIVPNRWDRLRKPLPGPRAHAFASTPLDAEVRTFLSPILLEQASLHKATHDEGDVLAVGCGDIDGDGGLELVLASRERVSLGRVRGGKFEVQKSAPWASLAARAPVPMREPMGTVVVSPRGHAGEIYLGMTDRGGVVTDANLVTKRVLTGLPIPGLDGDACMVQIPEAAAFDRRAVACNPRTTGDPATLVVLPSPKHDAASAFALVGKNGSITEIAAAREPGGKLRVRQIVQNTSNPAPGNVATMEDTGAQIAVADLDLDGVAEVVTTVNGMGDDAITVSSFDRSALVPRLHIAAQDGVRALGVCPPEERGVPALVAVVGSEVWLVR